MSVRQQNPDPQSALLVPAGTAGATSAEEQGPCIQSSPGSCPVQEQSYRADHEAGPQKEKNIIQYIGRSSTWSVYDRRIIINKCFPACQRLLFGHVYLTCAIQSYSELVPPHNVDFLSNEKKIWFAFQKKRMQLSLPAESLHDCNKAFLINGLIASHSKGRNERTVR